MPQPLASKERTLFAQVVKNYENKQYKKGIKAADQILKKNNNHGDTQAMKALILNSLGQSEEAFALAKEALRNDMKSHVCWHVYGLLYRSAKNFEESIKAYKFALKLEPESQQIQRDLALLQMQMRDYTGYVQSRRSMLQARPTLRSNWTALAIAQHLSGDLDGAEKTLTAYEESLRSPPPKTDIEHQEAALYKNTIIAEMGQLEKALEHLDAVAKSTYDKQSVLEMKANYLLKLDKKAEAEKIYRTLLDRNADNQEYYEGLINALDLDPSDTKALHELYESYAEKNERADTPRRAPLDFLQGEEFKQAADKYLQRMLTKGVPSTFANIKALYFDASKKDIIQDLAESYASGKILPQVNGTEKAESSNGKPSRFEQAKYYFLAQHYDYYLSRDLKKANDAIEKARELDPKSVDYNMTKGRILKHQGDIKKAAEQMEETRALDERDRYINTKAAKYQLRNDENEAALKNMGKFTRQDAVGGPLGDLIDMQCMWFLSEDGESYLRQNKIALALKRFTSVFNIFDVWQEDQFDFHSFSIRKGQVRAYVDLIRFEDRLREHPFFTRAAVGAIKAYILLYEQPDLVHGSATNGTNGKVDQAEQKKAAKRARKEKEKQEQLEAEKRDAKKTAGTGPDGETKKEDKDPEGKLLVSTEDPLKDAMKFIMPILELSPKNLDAQRSGFELYLRRGKFVPALRCLLSQQALSASKPTIHSQALRLAHALTSLSEPLPVALAVSIQKSLDTLLPSKPTSSADLKKLNDDFLEDNKDDPESVFAAWEVRLAIDKSDEGIKEEASNALVWTVESRNATRDDAIKAVTLARDWAISGEKVIEKAKLRWPHSTEFRSGRA